MLAFFISVLLFRRGLVEIFSVFANVTTPSGCTPLQKFWKKPASHASDLALSFDSLPSQPPEQKAGYGEGGGTGKKKNEDAG